MRIGFVVAMEAEYEPFLARLGNLTRHETLSGIEFCGYNSLGKSVVLAKCGIGTVAAAAATALLIGHYHCDRIMNYGLVGAIGDAPVGSLVAVRDVVHYDADLTPFGHPLGAAADMPSPYIPADPDWYKELLARGLFGARIASGDKFIASDKIKADLSSYFSADICDMESAGIALTCARAGVPFAMIKLVSDGAGDDAVSTYSISKESAFDFAIDAVLDEIRSL